MRGDDLPNILSVVSIVLTLIVVMYARGTIMEARRTTAEERSAVIQLTALGVAQQATVGELQTLGQGTKDLQEQASKAAMASLAQAKAASVEADQRAQEAAARAAVTAVAAAERDRVAAERAAARDRESFLEHRYERVLQIGELVEDMFWRLEQFRDWGPEHVGRTSGCRNVTASAFGSSASTRPFPRASGSLMPGRICRRSTAACSPRQEVEIELTRIDGEPAALRAAGHNQPDQ